LFLFRKEVSQENIIMSNKRFSPKVKQVISRSRDVAVRLGHDYIGTEHLASNASLNVGNIPLNKQAEKVLKVTFLEARMLKNEEIAPEHLMLSILKHKENLASKILNQFDVDYDIYKAELEYVRQEQDMASGQEPYSQAPSEHDDPYEEEESQSRFQRKGSTKSRTPVLDNFGRDITKLAEEDKLDPDHRS
jgi:ATP-dependent Clp protease ATP-binding subunit ClpC